MDPVLIMLGALGASSVIVGWRNRLRGRRAHTRHRELQAALDDNLQVMLHLAQHEAHSRSQPLAPTHVLAALVQDELIAAAITQLGGDPVRVEAAIDAALDRLATTTVDPSEVGKIFGYALVVAKERDRPATCADVMGAVVRRGHAALLEVPPVTAYDLLFTLVHGRTAPPSEVPGAAEVFVVLRNDDLSTKEFVVQVLRETFGLPADTATTLMQTVHDSGRAAVARLPAAVARDRILAARALARTSGMPLWLGVEAC